MKAGLLIMAYLSKKGNIQKVRPGHTKEDCQNWNGNTKEYNA